MQTCEPFDVVAVPFPYIEREVRKRRPTLVVCSPGLVKKHGLLWVLMITAAAHRGWPDDVEIDDHAAAGLPIRSIVRTAKIATIAGGDARRLGTLPPRLYGKLAALMLV